MSKRKRYSPEYKRELVDVVRRSRSSCRQIALEVGVNPNQLSRWVREAAAGGGKAFPGGGVPRDEAAWGALGNVRLLEPRMRYLQLTS
jgi:transposase